MNFVGVGWGCVWPLRAIVGWWSYAQLALTIRVLPLNLSSISLCSYLWNLSVSFPTCIHLNWDILFRWHWGLCVSSALLLLVRFHPLFVLLELLHFLLFLLASLFQLGLELDRIKRGLWVTRLLSKPSRASRIPFTAVLPIWNLRFLMNLL